MSVVITSLSIPAAGTKYVARRCDIAMVSQAVEGTKMKSGWMSTLIQEYVPGKYQPGMIRGIEPSIGSFPFQSNGCRKMESKQGDPGSPVRVEENNDTSGAGFVLWSFLMWQVCSSGCGYLGSQVTWYGKLFSTVG